MDWLNIRVSTLRAPEYIGSEPVERAAWFNVLCYCVEQENGGRIEGAAQWKDRQWQQTCGVTLREVNKAGRLLSWEDEALLVWNFPTCKQAEVQAKREAGRIGGVRSGEARRAENRSTASSCASLDSEAHASTEREREVEREVEVEVEEERKEKSEPPSPPVGFELFWSVYPRKVGKGHAEKAWKTHKCAEKSAAILAAVEAAKQSADWRKEGGAFIPHPATWISRRGWEDELLPFRGPAGRVLGTPIRPDELPYIMSIEEVMAQDAALKKHA